MSTIMKQSTIRLYEILKKNNIINEVKSGTIFYDEPKFYFYTADINPNLPCMEGVSYEITTGGLSVISREKALLKCIMECIERYSLFSSSEPYIKSSYNDLKKKALDPFFFTHVFEIRNKNLSWTEGHEVISLDKILLPAQLVDLNNKKFKNEDKLTTVISTGAAAEFNHESVLLAGIYEIIERDAFMTIYLNKIQTPKVELSALKNKTINNIVDSYKRYKLEIFVFDITHDLGIPIFLSILVDRTGIGPAITVGAKANINSYTAIIGCMEEAYMARPWIRYEMLKGRKPLRLLNPLISRLDRALLWSFKKNINKLDFLLSQRTKEYKQRTIFGITNKETELSFIIKKLQNKGLSIYYKDITATDFIPYGCKVYKTIIPGLQPLYLFNQELNIKRLSEVSTFFNQTNTLINTFPHPFL